MIVEDVGCTQDLAGDKYPVDREVKHSAISSPQIPMTASTHSNVFIKKLAIDTGN